LFAFTATKNWTAIFWEPYDADGRLIATEDAEGHRIEFEHDIAGRTQRVRGRGVLYFAF